MIAAIQQAVAAALVARAQSAPFSQEITATAEYLPHDDLAVQTGIKVYVVPSSIASEVLSRGSEEVTYSVDVVVVTWLRSGDKTSIAWANEMTGLLSLVHEISGYLRRVDMAGANWQASQISPLYDPRRLKEQNVFLSVIRLTYWAQE